MEIAKAKVQRYEKYKDSGVIWLGDIPEHWKIESFKNILTERNEKNQPIRTKEILSLSIDKGVTLYAEKTTNLDRFKDDFSQYKLAYKGDLVLNSMNMIVGAVGVSDYFGCVSPVYYTYHGGLDNSFTSRFYEYLFRCKTVQGVLYSLGKGLIAIDRGEGKYNTLRLKVSRDDLRFLKLPFPNHFEQTAIVNYLDRKIDLIEQAINIKQKQIELLKERRQILIHKAVTRGLNTNVKMKDSGVEWIGEIPEGWEVKRLASFGKFSKGGGFSKGDLTESGVSAILYGDIYTKYDIEIKHGVRFISNETAKKSIEIKKGNLLFTGSGETMEDIGKCVVFSCDEKTVAGGDVIIFQQNQNDNLYLSYVLNTEGAKFEKAKHSKGEIIVHTYGSKLRNIYIPIPPKQEQIQIAEYIKATTTKIATAVSLKEQEIEKLKEYKATLINSAVTGKIKVC